jgi:hypothetical protein
VRPVLAHDVEQDAGPGPAQARHGVEEHGQATAVEDRPHGQHHRTAQAQAGPGVLARGRSEKVVVGKTPAISRRVKSETASSRREGAMLAPTVARRRIPSSTVKSSGMEKNDMSCTVVTRGTSRPSGHA